KIENLSKQYRLGTIGTGTIAHDLNRWWQTKILHNEDPYLKIGEVNDRAHKGHSEYVWALKDINLEVKEGDVVGIIGKNGAGKSTLLKILSRVTAPTTGSIKVRGRLASLLEVGTGFHPELTGRENIFLNGAILGMTKAEIRSKLNEIIDFSGCERYIDTPVKRYSSGMNVRLGFAVAAFLEPEILVVDEVLAVGDAEFQKKAIGKMQDVSTNDGRTVLFVSHNMAAVKSLCNNGIVLTNGTIDFKGKIDSCITNYLKIGDSIQNYHDWKNNPEIYNSDIELLEIGINAKNKKSEEPILMTDEIEFTAKYWQKSNNKRYDITLHFKDEQGNKLFSAGSFQKINKLINEETQGIYTVTGLIPSNFFNYGTFYIDIYFVLDLRKTVIIENDILSFTVSNKSIEIGQYMGKEPGALHPLFIWEKYKINS
ncbi:MAG: ATP-binding cassette domain-containing protein, partial [Marinilabiliaceae bacterium]|nr:ATP-binding cassette domain-containing protein [Marinilabiliaceae bacterium]